MKICYVTDYLPHYHRTWGGAEQACYRLSRLLAKKGHQVTILATNPLREPEEDFDFFALPVLENCFPTKLRPHLYQLKLVSLSYDLISGIASYKILKQIKPDLLHLHNFYSLTLALLQNAWKLGIPIVYSVYDYSLICPMGHLRLLKDYASYEGTECIRFNGPHCVECLSTYKGLNPLQKLPLSFILRLRKRISDSFLKKIDNFIVLSGNNARVLERYGIERERISIVPIPLSEEISTQPIEENLILYVGWIQPRKGPHIILEAMPQILKRVPDAKLYIIGEFKANKEYEEKIRRLLSQSEVRRHVFILGRRPYHEVKAFMGKANVLVIPEQWETIPPNILTEGMVFGRAIVASRIGGILDFIREFENGLLADAENPTDFADKIASILENEDLRQRLCRGARETGLNLFSEEKVYDRLLDLYQSLRA